MPTKLMPVPLVVRSPEDPVETRSAQHCINMQDWRHFDLSELHSACETQFRLRFRAAMNNDSLRGFGQVSLPTTRAPAWALMAPAIRCNYGLIATCTACRAMNIDVSGIHLQCFVFNAKGSQHGENALENALLNQGCNRLQSVLQVSNLSVTRFGPGAAAVDMKDATWKHRVSHRRPLKDRCLN